MKQVQKIYPEIDLDEIYTEDALQWLYNEFLFQSDLPESSADELILEITDPDQRRWLSAFIVSWEKTQELADETEWLKYAAQKSGLPPSP
jgi:hypothetical protein